MNGVMNLDKPARMSSAQAVNRVKRLLPRGTRIGHAGTLDPFATGLLLLLLGKATKTCEQWMDKPKTYNAIIKLGATTATDDPESAEQPYQMAGPPPSGDEVQRVLDRFVGTIQQRPPAFSAMKIAGKRAYNMARRGQVPDLAPRPVTVYAIELMDYTWPLVHVRVECGRGTYIRSLARDIGEALRTGGYLTHLRRTRIGEASVEQAVTLQRLMADGVAPHVRPFT